MHQCKESQTPKIEEVLIALFFHSARAHCMHPGRCSQRCNKMLCAHARVHVSWPTQPKITPAGSKPRRCPHPLPSPLPGRHHRPPQLRLRLLLSFLFVFCGWLIIAAYCRLRLGPRLRLLRWLFWLRFRLWLIWLTLGLGFGFGFGCSSHLLTNRNMPPA